MKVRHLWAVCLFCFLFGGGIMPGRAQDDTAVQTRTVNFDEYSFTYSDGLGYGVALNVYLEPMEDAVGELQPPHVEIWIGSNQALERNYFGAISFYRVADTVDHPFYETIQRLQALITERPDLAEQTTLPTLYPFMVESLFARARYAEAAGFSGISFLNGRVFALSDEYAGLYRYNFEGISADGEWYVSAHYTVLEVELPEELDASEDVDAYIKGARTAFDTLPDDAFTPSLDLLDQLFATLNRDEGGA